MKAMNTNLVRILEPFGKRRLWIALTPDLRRVGASARTPEAALAKAQKAGIEKPVIMHALPDYSGFVSPATQ